MAKSRVAPTRHMFNWRHWIPDTRDPAYGIGPVISPRPVDRNTT